MNYKCSLLMLLVFISLGPLGFIGCSTEPIPAFTPNAKLPTFGWTDSSPDWCISSEFNVSLLVNVESISEYAKQSKGDWIHHWYVCKMKKISIMEGFFDSEELSFIYKDSQPSPTAPFRIQKTPFPYHEGMVFLLGIDTKTKPFKILCQEQMSWIAPHGKLKKLTGKIDDFDKIMSSVMCFLSISNDVQISKNPEQHYIVVRDIGYLKIVEETEEYYVVYANLVNKTATIIVQKNTLAVKPLQSL